ncbi:hypothetical protein Metho_2156 [Methanomethylovorans hollandica DSM 15978]|uniref:S-layer domain-containing protein n=1 Tax=Methanomethylovorans hollandica (strain DSM 15978 / NBRC 107637 / DMS1) TaxID=867904 RepID=L0L231_METHD|nr:hypothetical protein [Methanomethylovorans hollandica]AGB50319.1 hypothetical protein Metho_2156 [Methanomethylovorans hollandica DSM 15978]
MITLKNLKFISIAILLLSSMQFASAGIDENVVAEIASDYYDVYGSPNLIANLACDEVFERGEKGILYVNILNNGQITGFEANEDEIEDDIDEYGETLTRTYMSSELLSDRAITTADSMTATLSLVDPDAPIKIEQDTLLLGSLNAGKSLSTPAEFPIEIYDNAKAGTYDLQLYIAYRSQKDSAVTPPYGDTNYWYEDMNQTMILQVVVEEEPYFRIDNVESDLRAGDEKTINVTYTNTGEQIARECIARISVVDPFTTTDDQAYLGDMHPGESRTAIFDLNVAKDATVKEYSISSEIKYKDEQDKSQYSDNLKLPVYVGPAESLNASVAVGLVLLVGIIGTPVYMISRKRKQNNYKKYLDNKETKANDK